MTAPVFYFVGGEDSDFTSVGTVSVTTTASHRRTTYSRCALQAADGDSFWDTGNVMSVTSAWFHARVWMGASGATSSLTVVNRAPIRLVDSAGITRLGLVQALSGTTLANYQALSWTVGKYNSAGTYTQIGSIPSGIFTGSPSSPDALDIHLSSYGASGTLDIYINGTLVFSFTGDLHTDSNTTINGMRLAGGLASSSGFQYPLAYSEVIISDTDTRFMTLETLTPAADGNTVTWDVGGVSNINETTEDDTTLNSSSTPGQVQQYTTNGLPAGTYGVLAVVLSGKMIGGTGGGPTQVEFGVRTGGVDAWGSDVLLPVSLQTVQYPFYVDPNTSSPFDPTNLGAGFNIGLKSVA